MKTDISLCGNCYCMTHTTNLGNCGKCGAVKGDTSDNTNDQFRKATKMIDQPDDLRATISKSLHHAYYNGLDKKGYSEYEEKADVEAVMQAFASELERIKPQMHGGGNWRRILESEIARLRGSE